ncbi:hypothetical protein [Streptomyces sp. NPDC017095]|uniref:hypothetical protein n=1 Tax=Streptomyces sp. NPDC017095 TaxID=3364977 RepID=UPI00379A233A
MRRTARALSAAFAAGAVLALTGPAVSAAPAAPAVPASCDPGTGLLLPDAFAATPPAAAQGTGHPDGASGTGGTAAGPPHPGTARLRAGVPAQGEPGGPACDDGAGWREPGAEVSGPLGADPLGGGQEGGGQVGGGQTGGGQAVGGSRSGAPSGADPGGGELNGGGPGGGDLGGIGPGGDLGGGDLGGAGRADAGQDGGAGHDTAGHDGGGPDGGGPDGGGWDGSGKDGGGRDGGGQECAGADCAGGGHGCGDAPGADGCAPAAVQHGVDAGQGGVFGDSVPALAAGAALIAVACAGAGYRVYGRVRSAAGRSA